MGLYFLKPQFQSLHYCMALYQFLINNSTFLCIFTLSLTSVLGVSLLEIRVTPGNRHSFLFYVDKMLKNLNIKHVKTDIDLYVICVKCVLVSMCVCNCILITIQHGYIYSQKSSSSPPPFQKYIFPLSRYHVDLLILSVVFTFFSLLFFFLSSYFFPKRHEEISHQRMFNRPYKKTRHTT